MPPSHCSSDGRARDSPPSPPPSSRSPPSSAGGSPSGEAIRDFLAFAFHSWKAPAPRYVLLLGDASYDPRNFTGSDPGAPLPALWTKTSYLWTASDPALAAVNGEDLLPDLALGRLPATNLAQAQALVQKVLDWEDAGYDLSGPATLVADNPDRAGNFEADIADISNSFLGTSQPPEPPRPRPRSLHQARHPRLDELRDLAPQLRRPRGVRGRGPPRTS